MRRIFSIWILSSLSLYSVAGFAAASATVAPDATGTFLSVVVVDGSMVYKKADFDAEVIGYLQLGTKVTISKKRFGPFYRIRFKQGVWGYVSDVDVRGPEDVTGKKGSLAEPKENMASAFRGKLPFTSFSIGASVGSLQYKELLLKQTYNSALVVYGIKANAPMTFLGGPFFFDLDVLTTNAVPDYYKGIATGSVQAQTSVVDLQVMYAMGSFMDRAVWYYFGAGPAMIYGRYLFDSSAGRIDAEELRMGASFTGGLSYTMSPLVLKFEPSFIVERTQYPLFVFSAQYSF